MENSTDSETKQDARLDGFLWSHGMCVSAQLVALNDTEIKYLKKEIQVHTT